MGNLFQKHGRLVYGLLGRSVYRGVGHKEVLFVGPHVFKPIASYHSLVFLVYLLFCIRAVGNIFQACIGCAQILIGLSQHLVLGHCRNHHGLAPHIQGGFPVSSVRLKLPAFLISHNGQILQRLFIRHSAKRRIVGDHLVVKEAVPVGIQIRVASHVHLIYPRHSSVTHRKSHADIIGYALVIGIIAHPYLYGVFGGKDQALSGLGHFHRRLPSVRSDFLGSQSVMLILIRHGKPQAVLGIPVQIRENIVPVVSVVIRLCVGDAGTEGGHNCVSRSTVGPASVVRQHMVPAVCIRRGIYRVSVHIGRIEGSSPGGQKLYFHLINSRVFPVAPGGLIGNIAVLVGLHVPQRKLSVKFRKGPHRLSVENLILLPVQVRIQPHVVANLSPVFGIGHVDHRRSRSCRIIPPGSGGKSVHCLVGGHLRVVGQYGTRIKFPAHRKVQRHLHLYVQIQSGLGHQEVFRILHGHKELPQVLYNLMEVVFADGPAVSPIDQFLQGHVALGQFCSVGHRILCVFPLIMPGGQQQVGIKVRLDSVRHIRVRGLRRNVSLLQAEQFLQSRRSDGCHGPVRISLHIHRPQPYRIIIRVDHFVLLL